MSAAPSLRGFADPVRQALALAGRRPAVLAGRRPAGKVPFGYRADGPRLVVHEQEAEFVRWLFREAINRPLSRIERALRIREVRRADGRAWNRATMSYMLRNVTYLGRAHLGGVSVQAHEPIVAPVVFYKAGQLLTARNKRGGKRGAELRALELRLGARSRVAGTAAKVAAERCAAVPAPTDGGLRHG